MRRIKIPCVYKLVKGWAHDIYNIYVFFIFTNNYIDMSENMYVLNLFSNIYL